MAWLQRLAFPDSWIDFTNQCDSCDHFHIFMKLVEYPRRWFPNERARGSRARKFEWTVPPTPWEGGWALDIPWIISRSRSPISLKPKEDCPNHTYMRFLRSWKGLKLAVQKKVFRSCLVGDVVTVGPARHKFCDAVFRGTVQ